MRLLNITDNDRSNCKVTYNVNRFEVYHNDGWMLTVAYTKADLKQQLSANKIVDAVFDNAAIRQYRK